MYIALFKIGWLPWWTYHYKMISVRKPMIFKSWICLCVVCVVVCTVQCCSTAVQVKFDVTDNPECAFWVWKYTNGRQMSECCKMIPMILTIDLNSLKYDKIGSTPDAAFPRLFVFRAITFRCILFFWICVWSLWWFEWWKGVLCQVDFGELSMVDLHPKGWRV